MKEETFIEQLEARVAECHEPTESFLRHFPVQPAAISKDGRDMRFDGGSRPVLIQSALEVIRMLRLPLMASTLDGDLYIIFNDRQ